MTKEQGGNCEAALARYEWAIDVPLSTPLARPVLLIMVRHCDAEGRCSLTHAEIAQKAKISERQLTREIALMGEFIVRVRDGDVGAGRKPDKLLVRIPGTIADCASSIVKTVAAYQSAIVTDTQSAIAAVSDQQSATVTDRLSATGAEAPHAPPRVVISSEFKNLELEPTTELNPSTPQPREAPEVVVVVDWKARLLEAEAIMGDRLTGTDPASHTAREFRNWCEPATGPACDWERDVVEALRQIAAQLRLTDEKISKWAYCKPLVIKLRDARLLGLPAPKPPERRPAPRSQNVFPPNGIFPIQAC